MVYCSSPQLEQATHTFKRLAIQTSEGHPPAAATAPPDQRSVTRLQDSAHDLGAFESQGFNLTVSGGVNLNTLLDTAFAPSLVVTVTVLDGVSMRLYLGLRGAISEGRRSWINKLAGSLQPRKKMPETLLKVAYGASSLSSPLTI